MIDARQELRADLRILVARADLVRRDANHLRGLAIEKVKCLFGDSELVAEIAGETIDVEDCNVDALLDRLELASLEAAT